MELVKTALVAFASGCLLAGTAPGGEAEKARQGDSVIKVLKEPPPQPEGPVELSEEEWQARLTEEQFRILRREGTERSFGEVYEEFKEQGAGTYYCAGCDAELFTSDEKFDSRCGWPSFYDPSKAKNVNYTVDFHLGYPRTEVRCKICDGHLGHVFEGEGFDTPTDRRYCINGTVLKFVPAEEAETSVAPPDGAEAAEGAPEGASDEAEEGGGSR